MAFRSLRESRQLSQERVADLSGLSLRTIQRLEAGHRVSYASLRALAITFEMDVDALAAGMSMKEWWAWRPARTLRGTVIDYGFVVLVLGLFFGLVFSLS